MSPATLLRALIVLALIPSLLALTPRLQAEHPGPVVLVIDGNEVNDEARLSGQTFEQTLAQYKSEGIGGVAVYEQTVGSLLEQGLLLSQAGGTLSLQYPQAGFRLGWSYLAGDPEFLRRIAAQWDIPSEFRSAGGRTWLGTPVNVASYPVGYDAELVRRLKADGYYLVFRPINAPRRKLPTPPAGPAIVPPEADAIVFNGTEVLGIPNQLEEAIPLLQGKPIGWIEATPQEGFPRLARELPVLRLFSLKPEWQDKLKPAEVADKFVLAARERGHQILYLRPYATPEDTRTLLARLKDDLERSHIPIGTPKVRDFTPSPLRLAAWVGVLAGLALLALGYPAGWGWPLAGLLLLGALGYARSDAGPLLAALVFPVLGFLERRRGMGLWLAAVLYALAGVVFLAALGSDPRTVLGLETFKGVSLTLVVPPLLVALSFLPAAWKPALERLWAHPVRLGEVSLVLLGLAAVALAVLRRGNDAAGSIVPEWELQLRAWLQDAMVRPRFKEIFAHALAPIALLIPWPTWIKNGMLILIAVGIASILNTFSHYHTPLEISLFRVLNGILVGLILGGLGLLVVRRLRRWWLG